MLVAPLETVAPRAVGAIRNEQTSSERVAEVGIDLRVGGSAALETRRAVDAQPAVDLDEPRIERGIVGRPRRRAVVRVKPFDIIAIGPRLDVRRREQAVTADRLRYNPARRTRVGVVVEELRREAILAESYGLLDVAPISALSARQRY